MSSEANWINWGVWLEESRGISPETVKAFELDWNDQGELIIPYMKGTKRRYYRDGERHFAWDKGSVQTLFSAPGTLEAQSVAFLVEGETDTMRLWQEIGDTCNVFGLPGVTSWKPEWSEWFQYAEQVFVILDADTAYEVRDRADSAWRQIRKDIGPKAKRIDLRPANVKDLCEFFQQGYEMDDLRKMAVAEQSRYKPLDLRDMRPRQVDWMVEGLIGRGDVCLMFGDPGVGKSWLSMSLALAVLHGDETWLGRPLKVQGKVLYVDEENPEAVVYSRLQRLGLRPSDAPNLRYLHEQGIRLDRRPEEILEEALAFEPALIVLDSLTRIHTENENDAGAISRIFNDGIKPLARQTGATVLLLHHARKPGENTSSYSRARGSGDITAATDAGLDIRPLAPGHMNVVPYRSRRGLPDRAFVVKIMDTEEGVRVVTNIEAPPPF